GRWRHARGIPGPGAQRNPEVGRGGAALRRQGGLMRYDLVVRNGIVVDGTRAPRHRADLAISGDRITALGSVPEKGKNEIDASGFIDAHTHDDRLMLSSPDMAPKVSQGVTTVVAGNCGISLAPAPRGMNAPV